MISKIESFLSRYYILILFGLLVTVLYLNSQYLSWGLPAFWNPDELSHAVNSALNGTEKFNQTNFDYPSLPKYFMLFIGYVTEALGFSRLTFLLSARFMSVFLGAICSWLTYAIIRQLGGKHWASLLAALLIVTNSELVLNSHFAHNDLYVTYFAGMTLFLSIKYLKTHHKIWLYFSFFSAGLTASSKYNGGGIVLVALLAYLLLEDKQIFKNKIKVFETLFVGAGLSILGYGIGTPTALTSFSFYIKRLLPALWRHANFNRTPTSQLGLIKQWEVMRSVFGDIVFGLFLISLISILVSFLLIILKKKKIEPDQFNPLLLIVVTVLVLDLPILISYNVQNRFFLPLLIPFAVIFGVALEKFINWMVKRETKKVSLIISFVLIAILHSEMRVISVNLLFKNDARYSAAEFIKILPSDKSLEYTFYSPNIQNESRFSSVLEYPLVFLKFKNQYVLGDGYNIGEEGIEDRQPDFFVISSFIYNRFSDPYICENHLADCKFFTRLLAGETNYHQIGEFKYDLPDYLPKLNLTFLNPVIKIYERKTIN